MSSEWTLWTFIIKYVLSIIQKRIPGWILKKWFPLERCISSIDIFLETVGPRIYINPKRSFAISSFKINFLNRLPFKIEFTGFTTIEIKLEDKGWLNFQHIESLSIDPCQLKELYIPEKHLTDSQAKLAADYPSECPILRIHGSAQIKSPIGNFNKIFSEQTQAFIHK